MNVGQVLGAVVPRRQCLLALLATICNHLWDVRQDKLQDSESLQQPAKSHLNRCHFERPYEFLRCNHSLLEEAIVPTTSKVRIKAVHLGAHNL